MENEARARSGDYLWDRSGEPDPEVQSLEAMLGKFRHDRPAPVFPAVVGENAHARQRALFPWRMRLVPALVATGAAAALALAAVTLLVYGGRTAPGAVASWGVSRLAGTPRIGATVIGGNDSGGRLGIGQVLETDPQSRASLLADDVGQIEVGPNTRLRLLMMGAGLKRIALERGIIHAYIWARPGQFVVDTPSAVTVDLGCAYSLQVDDSGAGLVRTSRGWVGFKLNGREAFIPAGAACATRPKVGPGTPYFENAPLELRAALVRFDFEDRTPEQRAADLAIVLGAARKRDALTVWHLLARVEKGQRALVYDRLRELAPPPAGVTKDGILGLDQPMLDLWWNGLGFDNVWVWRHWERLWGGGEAAAQSR